MHITDSDELVENFKKALESCGKELQEIHSTEEYKSWEAGINGVADVIRGVAENCDPRESLVAERTCLRNDLAFHHETENEYGLRHCRNKIFECECALAFLQDVVDDPGKYQSMASQFSGKTRIPTFDSYVHAWLSLYRGLESISHAASVYDYTPYYEARLHNMRAGLRGYRRLQRRIIAG